MDMRARMSIQLTCPIIAKLHGKVAKTMVTLWCWYGNAMVQVWERYGNVGVDVAYGGKRDERVVNL